MTPRLPPHPAPSSDAAPSEHDARSARPGWRVLLAEDDSAMREMLATVLAADGYEVIEARDGDELISRLHDLATMPHGRDTLAVVISDVRMPKLDGLDVLTALRCASWRTPVILITAFGDEGLHREARALGATELLDKPFSLDRLLSLLRRIVPH